MTATPTTPAADRQIAYMPLTAIKRAKINPKRHAAGRIAASISRFGLAELPLLDERTGRLVAGHGRLDEIEAALARGAEPPQGVRVDTDGSWLVPVQRGWASRSDDDAHAYVIASNRITELGGWDDAGLAQLLTELNSIDPALAEVAGYDDSDLKALLDGLSSGESGGGGAPGETRPTLADRFLIPPFDVLDARQGWWQERKRAWIALGIRSEVGRGPRLTQTSAQTSDMDFYRRRDGELLYRSASGGDPSYYDQKNAVEARLGRPITNTEFEAEHYVPTAGAYESGTSIFDPVLCELVYRWFTPPSGAVLDPFAGGSVRGLVAHMLGRTYTGNDLSAEQVDANRAQASEFRARGLIDTEPQWSVGDSAEWVTALNPGAYDAILTCPPYLWLERYSDDPADLSNMDANAFEDTYTRIIAGAAAALAPNRYAVFVVGDVREPRGDRLIDFRGMTIRAADAAGLRLQSAAVLVTAVGSLAVRAGRQFSVGRLLGRTHQDVLIFCNGDRAAAVAALGPVQVVLPDALSDHFDPADADVDADLPVAAPDYAPDHTPVQTHGGYLVKRDDAWTYRGASGAKARTMIRAAQATGAHGIVSCGARISPQLERAALAAAALGIPARLHTGQGSTTDEMRTAIAAGAELVQHRPARMSVIRARYAEDAARLADTWLCVPYGMDLPSYVEDIAAQVHALPFGDFDRIVVPTGSGMTLAGILQGLATVGQPDLPVLGVRVGGDPTDRLNRYAPDWTTRPVTVLAPDTPYDEPAPHTTLGDLRLDPHYEAKCLPHLRDRDLLWAVGLRASASPHRTPSDLPLVSDDYQPDTTAGEPNG